MVGVGREFLCVVLWVVGVVGWEFLCVVLWVVGVVGWGFLCLVLWVVGVRRPLQTYTDTWFVGAMLMHADLWEHCPQTNVLGMFSSQHRAALQHAFFYFNSPSGILFVFIYDLSFLRVLGVVGRGYLCLVLWVVEEGEWGESSNLHKWHVVVSCHTQSLHADLCVHRPQTNVLGTFSSQSCTQSSLAKRFLLSEFPIWELD